METSASTVLFWLVAILLVVAYLRTINKTLRDINARLDRPEQRDGDVLVSREEAAKIAEDMCPHGGRLWTDEQGKCFEALTECAANIRALTPITSRRKTI